MTLPDERYRAVMNTRMFLVELCNPEATPRVPKAIRDNARWCLRHYPNTWDMDQAAEGAPHIFQERIEDVQRMVMQYKLGKTDEA